jgi:hypothetical protein
MAGDGRALPKRRQKHFVPGLMELPGCTPVKDSQDENHA